jgi:hypothetical protein
LIWINTSNSLQLPARPGPLCAAGFLLHAPVAALFVVPYLRKRKFAG